MAATAGFYGRPRPALSNGTINASANGFYCGYTLSRNSGDLNLMCESFLFLTT